MTPEFLNQAMLMLVTFFQSGFDRVVDPLRGFLGMLLAIDMLLFGMYVACGRSNLLGAAFAKVLYIGMILHLLTAWPVLVRTLTDGFIWLGLLAGGNTLTLGTFLNPAALLARGLQVSAPLMTSIASFGLLTSPVSTLINFVLGLGLFLTFVLMAGRLFLAIVELYFGMVVTAFMLPWAIITATAPFAQSAIGYIVSSAYKLGILAFVMSGVSSIVAQMAFEGEPTWAQALTTLAVMAILALVVLFSTRIAAGVLGGGPVLTAGALLHAAGLVASGIAGVATGGVASATRVAGTAIAAGTAARTAYAQGGAAGVMRLPASFAASSSVGHSARQYMHASQSRGQAIGAHAADRAQPVGPPPPPAPLVQTPAWARTWASQFRASSGPASRLRPDM